MKSSYFEEIVSKLATINPIVLHASFDYALTAIWWAILTFYPNFSVNSLFNYSKSLYKYFWND